MRNLILILLFVFNNVVASKLCAQDSISFYISQIMVNLPKISISFLPRCDIEQYYAFPKSYVQVFENGKEITDFDFWSPDRKPHCEASFAIVLDRCLSSGQPDTTAFELIKQRAKDFIHQMDGLRDEAILISIGKEVSAVTPMTHDTMLLKKSIDSLQPEIGYRVWDGISFALDELRAKATNGCSRLLVFTNGYDRGSILSGQDVINKAFPNFQSVNIISCPQGANETTLQLIANDTGGKFILCPNTKSMIDLFEELTRLLFNDPIYCELSYNLDCADGRRRDVELIIDSVPDCPGSARRIRSYRAPLVPEFPGLPNILYPIQVEGIVVKGETDVDVAILINRSFNRVIDPTSFFISFDSSCAQFVSASTDNTLLEGLNVNIQQQPNGIFVLITQPRNIDRSGVLVRMKFHVRGTSTERECPLTLMNWSFQPECFVPKLISGKITILGSPTSIADESSPVNFSLSQNYPNPFTDRTTIRLNIEDEKLKMNVTSSILNFKSSISFKIFDLFGREVLDLSDEARSNSEITIHKSQLPHPGMYFYRLTTPIFSQTKSMVMMR